VNLPIERTPLITAASANQTDAIDLLVASGANVNAGAYYFGDPALHRASGRGSIEAVVALLEHEANVNSWNLCGVTPLHKVAEVVDR